MANVQIRDVPEDVHRRLKAQAAMAGQSLNEFLLARMADIARTPSVAELAERIRRRGLYEGPSSAQLIPLRPRRAVIVVDASTLTDYLVGREPALAAMTEALGADTEQPLHAPELVWPETLNALRRVALRGDISDDRATQAALELSEVRLVCYPHAPLAESVWSLRHDLTAYDATYLAVALSFDDPLLLTGDGGLAARAGVALGADRVTVTR